MTTVLVIAAVVILVIGLLAEIVRWKERAAALLEENIELSVQLDEHLGQDRPRIEFGPQIGAADRVSDFPDLLFTERDWHSVNPPPPNGPRRVVPFQRSPR